MVVVYVILTILFTLGLVTLELFDFTPRRVLSAQKFSAPPEMRGCQRKKRENCQNRPHGNYRYIVEWLNR